MNVTELARKLKVTTQELKDALPQLGFDIGQKAIKIDERSAYRIIAEWPAYKKRMEVRRREEMQKKAQDMREAMGDKEIRIPAFISVREFAAKVGLSVNQIITELMKNGVLASMNERIDFDTASIIGEDLGVKVAHDTEREQEAETGVDRVREIFEQESKEMLLTRPPVVVVMGHVDHGKTKLLDAIRTTDVVSQEKGGITQHIGAYQVTKNDKKITFIDTPGHEAFTAMRSRGAKIADIAILVVAADDSIKPQTVEAIKIIEKSKLPMLVAINKIDKPEANVDKVKQDLAQLNLIPEDWGGKTICVPISAKEGKNIDALLEMVLLVADVERDKIVANPDRSAVGSTVESHIDKGEGPVATVLVQAGTLRRGDVVAIGGVVYGKVRAMRDWHGDIVDAAPPSMPVKLIGLKVAPEVGDIVEVAADGKALEKIDKKKVKSSGQLVTDQASSATEEKDGEAAAKGIKIILKTDVFGSAEAIVESLIKIEHPDVFVKVISKRLGNITESDVLNAEAEGAFVVGFNVTIHPPVQTLAKEKGVRAQVFHIIYELLDFVKNELQKLLDIEVVQTKIGTLEVLKVFKKDGSTSIIGCRVKDGKVEPSTKATVYRKGEYMADGEVAQLQSGKMDVSDVLKGQECGIRFVGKVALSEGDTLEIFKEERREKKIA